MKIRLFFMGIIIGVIAFGAHFSHGMEGDFPESSGCSSSVGALPCQRCTEFNQIQYMNSLNIQMVLNLALEKVRSIFSRGPVYFCLEQLDEVAQGYGIFYPADSFKEHIFSLISQKVVKVVGFHRNRFVYVFIGKDQRPYDDKLLKLISKKLNRNFFIREEKTGPFSHEAVNLTLRKLVGLFPNSPVYFSLKDVKKVCRNFRIPFDEQELQNYMKPWNIKEL